LILAVFAFFKRGRYSFAWFLSFSVPGMIVVPLFIIAWISDAAPTRLDNLDVAVVAHAPDALNSDGAAYVNYDDDFDNWPEV
jgi:hypothetical protein